VSYDTLDVIRVPFPLILGKSGRFSAADAARLRQRLATLFG
jgi:hypothetical protein